MKKYSGNSIDEIIDVVALERGIAKSLIYYNVVEENSEQTTLNIFTDIDIIDFIHHYIETFFKNLEQEVYVDIRFSDGMYRVFVDAKNNAVIIGRAGQTLQALTNVVRGAANAHFKKHMKIVMDVNDYKANRYEKVESMVYRIAREVADTKVEATLDFIPSDERRVVHHYLSGMENISTKSIGEGKNRRLVITYKEDNEEN